MKLCKTLDLDQPGRNFYSLRHVFQTIAEEVDQPATIAIMGHVANDRDMGSVYRLGISDERLHRTVDHVKAWIGGIPVPWAEKPLPPVPFVSLDISHLQTGATTS
jgi:hypothetical protein